MSVVKKRNANYSKAELNCLLTFLEEHTDLVSSRLGGQFKTLNDLRLGWEVLADKVSAVGGYFGTKRTAPEVKRKWSDLKSRVKAKVAAIAMETPEGVTPNLNMKLTPVEERVLHILTNNGEEGQEAKPSILAFLPKTPHVKVFSFQNDSVNSEDISREEAEENYCSVEYLNDECSNANESEIVEEAANTSDKEKSESRRSEIFNSLLIKSSGSEDKKRRISEAFTSNFSDKKILGMKKMKTSTEEEQLQELCNSQQEINFELKSIKDILKKCQTSIEKIALLKRAELRLKCAKYGVEFEDLFD